MWKQPRWQSMNPLATSPKRKTSEATVSVCYSVDWWVRDCRTQGVVCSSYGLRPDESDKISRSVST